MTENEDYSHVTPKNCSGCNKSIQLARLDALPDTTFCVNCSRQYSPKVIYDPEVICAKASPSGQNGWSPKS